MENTGISLLLGNVQIVCCVVGMLRLSLMVGVGFFPFLLPPPPIGLTEHSVSGVHSNPGVLSKEKRLLRYLSYAAGQEMGYVICGRTKLALVCWLLSLSF